MAAVVTALVLIVFVLAQRYYASFIGRRVFDDEQPGFVTPAHEFEDGVDFVPTKRPILLGHHFTSIAGAAPIIGPCVAAYWGWLPALLWVVLGAVFMGAVHDYGALVVSVREKGRSIADVAAKVISGRVRLMFLCFIMVLSWLVLAVFAMAIAGLFMTVPTSVLPVNIAIVVALVVGWLLYKRKADALVPSLVALVVLYAFVWIGTKVPLDLADLGLDAPQVNLTWLLLLFAYSAVASLLPVWLLLQPRDYVNSHQLIVGLGLLFIGLFVAHPEFDAPAVRTSGEDAPSMFPLLFVTIACGAISGFHGLVSSGTTSKQIDKLEDARLIGYGSMLGEGALALAATMAACAGIGLVGFCALPGQGVVEDLSWAVYYDSWAHASGNKAAAFVLGGAAFLQAIGFSALLAQTLMAVLVISFASTTLDTATRIERFIIAEIGEATGVKALTNPYLATAIAVIPAILLATMRVSDGAGTREAAWLLWPVFGASNQMIASLTLLVLALYFWQQRRPVLPLVIPMLFVMVVTLLSLGLHLVEFWGQKNWLLLGLTVVLSSLILWMSVESLAVFARLLRERKAGESAA